jgi:hypothetical protein
MKPASSTLVAAAEALDAELSTFGDIAESLEHLALTSEKNLQKAARLLTEIVETEERLGTSMQAMIASLNAARDRQQTQAIGAQKRAEALRARTAVFQSLLERYKDLGSGASEINVLMQEIGGSNGSTEGEMGVDARPRIDRADQRLEQIGKDAEALAKSAQTEDFAELARHADSLRQQLVTARGKLNLIRKRIRDHTG